MISYSCWFIQVCVFFKSLAECSLGFTYVCVAAVDVTHGVKRWLHIGVFFVLSLGYHLPAVYNQIIRWVETSYSSTNLCSKVS